MYLLITPDSTATCNNSYGISEKMTFICDVNVSGGAPRILTGFSKVRNMGIFSFFRKGNKKQAIVEAVAHGAMIVDVRSAGEFQSGHVAGAVNVPLPEVESHFSKWAAAGKTVVFCCASGIRSGTASKKAVNAGLTAFNGGGWQSLNQRLKG